MNFCEKVELLDSLLAPFGFCFIPKHEIVTSRLDAWQKAFGYCSLFDRSALHFNMVFDCEPVYFYYCGKTWLIQFWKGQYGINIGGEIGIYRADGIIPMEKFDKTIFYGIPEDERFPLEMELNYKGQPLFSLSRKHWWLTGFRVSSYCNPEDLSMKVTIQFPNEEMLDAFICSMKRMAYNECDLLICDTSVSFTFGIPHSRQPRHFHRCTAAFSQWQNRIFCRLFHYVTRPFSCIMDKILYLYFFLPKCFRHLLRFKRHRRQKRKKVCRKKGQ